MIMKSSGSQNLLRVLLSFFLILLVSGQSAMAIKHSFIAIDEGLKNLLYVNENDSTKNWIVSVSDVYPSRDMQLIGNNRILIGNSLGYTEYNITTGAIARQVTAYDSVSSVRRLPNGHTILFGVDLAGSKGVVMIVLDSNNVQIKKTVFPGTYVRLARQTSTGTFILCCNDTIKEADTNGTFIWKKYVKDTSYPTNKHMWKAERLDNGHIFFSGGYGAFLAEMDTAGNFIRTIGAAPQPAGVSPFFYAMWQWLSNGDIVVANWENHGAGHDTAGKVHELIEFDQQGTIVWTWDKPTLVSSLQGVLILDSLNTNLLYDDRNGTMSPLNSPSSIRSSSSFNTQIPPADRWRIKIQPSSFTNGYLQSVDLLGRSFGPSPLTRNNDQVQGAGIYLFKSDAANKK
jgi:hypothetical protein